MLEYFDILTPREEGKPYALRLLVSNLGQTSGSLNTLIAHKMRIMLILKLAISLPAQSVIEFLFVDRLIGFYNYLLLYSFYRNNYTFWFCNILF